MTHDEIPFAFNIAASLFPRYSAKFRDDEVMRQWGKQLGDYTVDEVCKGFEALIEPTGDYMPTLAALLAEVRAYRKRNTPRLDVVQGGDERPLPTSEFLRKAQRRADDYREGLIKERVRYEGGVGPERLAEIRDEVYQVGPLEAAALAKYGVHVEVTMTPPTGGIADALSAAVSIPDPAPKSTDELAQEFAVRWRGARTAVEKEALRSEGQSMTPELRAAVKVVLGVPA